jgi:hypothetical protein
MSKKELLSELETIKKYIWLETGNANMLYGKREFIENRLNEIIEELKK